MPATSADDVRPAESAIRAAVVRLARPDGEGGAVVERAAIVAEGTTAGAIEEWILAHGGEPEAPLITAPRPGLYGIGGPLATSARHPKRYVLPVVELELSA